MIVNVATAEKFGLELCAALGLDGSMVKSLTITITAGEAVTVGAVQIVTVAQGEKMLSLFKQYEFDLKGKTS